VTELIATLGRAIQRCALHSIFAQTALQSLSLVRPALTAQMGRTNLLIARQDSIALMALPVLCCVRPDSPVKLGLSCQLLVPKETFAKRGTESLSDALTVSFVQEPPKGRKFVLLEPSVAKLPLSQRLAQQAFFVARNQRFLRLVKKDITALRALGTKFLVQMGGIAPKDLLLRSLVHRDSTVAGTKMQLLEIPMLQTQIRGLQNRRQNLNQSLKDRSEAREHQQVQV